MKYKCVNHLDQFWFRDAQMEKCEYQENRMTWVLSGAAARYNNPENETLTDRYIDTAQVRFLDVKIRRCFLEGQSIMTRTACCRGRCRIPRFRRRIMKDLPAVCGRRDVLGEGKGGGLWRRTLL